MPYSREEETQRVREQHLLRDERDYEVEAQGIAKAHHIILWISQILAALCVLQNNPAWAALFSLTFASAAAKFFHRFSSDREKAPLLLGIVSTAVALGLVAWFFLGNRPEWLTLGRLVEVVVLFQALLAVASLIFLGLTLGAFWLKFKIQHMDEDKWTAYFENMTTESLLSRMGIFLLLSLLATATLSYFLFLWRRFPCAWQLTVVFFVLGILRLSKKMGERREKLVTILLRFKSPSVDSDSEHDKSSDETLTN